MKDNKDLVDNTENKIKCVKCGKEVKDLRKGCSYCNTDEDYDYPNYNEKNNNYNTESIKEDISIDNNEEIIENDDIDNANKENNTIAHILKIVAWVILVLGFILGFVLGKDNSDEIAFGSLIQIWVIYGGIFLGIYALAEIIQILHDIRKKLYAKKDEDI